MWNVKITDAQLTRADFKRVLWSFPVRGHGHRSSAACSNPQLLCAPAATSSDSCLCAQCLHACACPLWAGWRPLLKSCSQLLLRLSAQEDRNSSWNTEGGAPTANLAAWTEVPLRAVSSLSYRNFEVRETQTFQPSGVALCAVFHPGGYLCPCQYRETPLQRSVPLQCLHQGYWHLWGAGCKNASPTARPVVKCQSWEQFTSGGSIVRAVKQVPF